MEMAALVVKVIVELVAIVLGIAHIKELRSAIESIRQEAKEIRNTVLTVAPREFRREPVETYTDLAEAYPLPVESKVRCDI